jgi:hypothetical protein
MRHVKKFLVLLVSLIILFLTYYLSACSLKGIIELALELVGALIATFMTWDFTLPLPSIIIHAAYVASVGLLVLLPVLGIFISLFKIGKKPHLTTIDYISLLAISITAIYLCTLYINSDDIIVVYSGLGLLGLLAIINIFSLADMKPVVKVIVKEVEVPSAPVEDKANEEVIEEKTEESQLEEVVEEQQEEASEEVKDELLGRTFKVIDGNRTLNIMVVGVNDQQTAPIFSTPENYAYAPVANTEAQKVEETKNEEASEEGEEKESLSYIDRLMASEESLKESYSQIKNELLRHRKVHSRISKSCETFRVGYDVIAKLVVAGKGLKLYLAMDPYSVDSAIYHQRDASSKKRFVEVPLVVKVKSNLSVKKALQLIDLTCEQKEVLPKSRYEVVDYTKVEVNQ